MTLLRRTLLRMVRDNVASGKASWLRFVGIDEDGKLVEELRTYPQLLERGERLAGALRAAGLGPGDRFGLLMQNRPAFVEAMIASEIAGTEFVSIDPRMRGEKLVRMLRFAGCRGVIVCSAGLASLAPVLAETSEIEWVWSADRVAVEAVKALDDVLRAAEPVSGPEAPLERTMQLIYTSSTTGDAKAIVITHGRFATSTATVQTFGMVPSDILYSGLSLTHANAQFISLGAALALNVPLVISHRFTKSRLWDLVGRYGCTVFNLLGGMTSAIFAEPPNPLERGHAVRMVISAGMPKLLWRRFEQRYSVEVLEFYGTAEGGLLFNPPGTGPVGSVGKPPAGLECAIVGEHDERLAPGVQGEICFRSDDGSVPEVRYLANEAASRAKSRGGWFRTGDIGLVDADGWFYFSHRAGRSVRRNGDFVDTAAIETFLAGRTEVDDVYVYGIRTERSTPGERQVVAAIVPQHDRGDAPALMRACLAELGTVGAPDFIQLLNAIPKTASEKPQERNLVAMINEGHGTIHDREGQIQILAREGRDDND